VDSFHPPFFFRRPGDAASRLGRLCDDGQVRLLRYVLGELALLVAIIALLATGLAQGALALGRAADSHRRREIARLYPPRFDTAAPPEPRIASDAAGTFLGMSDDLLLARLRSAPIVGAKLNKGGSSLSFRLDFADGSRAAFKPAQTNLQTIPRKEVAAYRLCRLLGLIGVPPAVRRSITRDELLGHLHPDSQPALPRIRAETLFDPQGKTTGAVSYWIPEIRDAGLDTPAGMQKSAAWLKIGQEIAPEDRWMAAQVSQLVVFDFLTSNPDRYSGGNIKASPEGDRLYFMDNTMAFFLGAEGHARNRAWLDRTERFSRRLWLALDRITERALQRLVGPDTDGQEILTISEIRAVVARRETVQRHVRVLLTAHEEAEVFAFP
jgi:hypothetical protein